MVGGQRKVRSEVWNSLNFILIMLEANLSEQEDSMMYVACSKKNRSVFDFKFIHQALSTASCCCLRPIVLTLMTTSKITQKQALKSLMDRTVDTYLQQASLLNLRMALINERQSHLRFRNDSFK